MSGNQQFQGGGLLGGSGLGGALCGGLGQIGQSFIAPPANVVIPISAEVWGKLSNETKLAILRELGIVEKEKHGSE